MLNSSNQPEVPWGDSHPSSDQDHLATDRIGEELEPDANIWRIYSKEARKYDSNLTHEQGKDLDNILLFSGLLLSLVAQFAGSTMGYLSPDSASVTNQLLLMLVESQQRIEAGTPNATSPPAQMSQFVPAAADRVINVFYFTSLMISLGSALVALLAKEWLGAYMTNHSPRSHAQSYALERQARFERLSSWNMLAIIDLLPMLLTLALLIFSLGLVVDLWTYDLIVARVITIISVLVGVSYGALLLLGTLFPQSPYQTRLTNYIRRIIPQKIMDFLKKRQNTTPYPPNNTKQEEINSLTWLFNHSNEPNVRSSVVQALAGLKASRSRSEQSDMSPSQQLINSLTPLCNLAREQLQKTINMGFNEFTPSQGSSAARLAIAISETYPYALACQTNAPGINEKQERISQTTNFKDVYHDGTQNLGSTMPVVTESVFDTLDLLWPDTYLLLKFDVHAYALIAELKIIRDAFEYSIREKTLPRSPVDHSIDMVTATKTFAIDWTRLQKQYTRAFDRILFVLEPSLGRLKGKDGQFAQSIVTDLLKETTDTVRVARLNSNGPQCVAQNGATPTNLTTYGDTIHPINLRFFAILLELCCNDIASPLHRLQGSRGAAFDLLVELWTTYLRPEEVSQAKIPAWLAPQWSSEDTDRPDEENRQRLAWCVGHLITITDTLTSSTQLLNLFSGLRSIHSGTQNSAEIPQHSGLQVDQVMQLIDAASQAPGRDTAIPVIPTLLAQVRHYIQETNCGECLKGFTEGESFDILAKLGLIESDREAVASAVRDIVLKLYEVERLVKTKVLPSLSKSMCHLYDRKYVMGDAEAVINGALFQFEQLPRFRLDESRSRQLIDLLRESPEPSKSQAETSGADIMSSLEEDFRRWVQHTNLDDYDETRPTLMDPLNRI